MLTNVKKYYQDPLYRNSFFIMLTSVTGAGFGFFFWMLAAKLYPKEDVGVATALISSMSLLVLISRFGHDFSIIRFFPLNDKSRVFSTSALITTLSAVIFGAVFIHGVDVFSPELTLLGSPMNAALFLIFVAASSVTSLTAVSFIAIRKAAFNFLQSLVVGSRIIFLIPLIFLGTIGIFGAVGISFVLSLVMALAFLIHSGIRPQIIIDRTYLKNSLHFSAGNYVTGLLTAAPNMILPILVLNVLGAEEAAHYYIAYSIAALLFMIPSAISTSLFVEGSHGEALKKTTIKSLIAMLALLIPAAGVLYFTGEWLLGLVGRDYAASGIELLRIMVLASFFVAVVSVYISIKRIQKNVKTLIVLCGLVFALLLGLAYVFMLWFGPVGLAYAWVVSYGTGSAVVGVLVWREGWI